MLIIIIITTAVDVGRAAAITTTVVGEAFSKHLFIV